MGAKQDPITQPSEKDQLLAQYNQEQQHQLDLDRGRPRNSTSISLDTSISPLSMAAGTNNSILSSHEHTSSTTGHLPQTPPPYSGPASNSLQLLSPTQQFTHFARSGSPQKYPGLPLLNYHLYSPPLFDLSSDGTSIKSTAPYLSSSATALIALLRAQATVPSKPQVHITGRRGGPHHRPDFALKLNLMHLLVPDDPSKRMDYIRCVASGEPALRGGVKPSLEPELEGLEAWARRFVEDDAQVKEFVLERVVLNLDKEWLEGQIRSLVAGMGYKGVVSVTFPVTHAKVVVQNPDKLNKFFTGLAALLVGRRSYEVVKAIWPFASCKRDEGVGRVCVVQSEEQWWKEWAQPIRFAIASRRNGWVTSEDKLEAIMEGKGKGLVRIDWGEGDGSW
ncbi:hypothetical protein N0V82_003512 [Gnomoniopsis sp. IMI 355080]|nr:hypothetical protein N0V82_003512 [Gnomoniopsis sp. IMI 355080]